MSRGKTFLNYFSTEYTNGCSKISHAWVFENNGFKLDVMYLVQNYLIPNWFYIKG